MMGGRSVVVLAASELITDDGQTECIKIWVTGVDSLLVRSALTRVTSI